MRRLPIRLTGFEYIKESAIFLKTLSLESPRQRFHFSRGFYYMP